MKLSFPYLMIVFFAFFLNCSPKYKAYKKAINDLSNKRISKVEYDRIMEPYYVINKANFNINNKLKLNASYIKESFNDYYKRKTFQSIKFTDSLISIHSYIFYDQVTNEVVSKTSGVTYRYTNRNEEILIEDLTNKDFKLENIGRIAKISINGDTLTFYKLINLRKKNLKFKTDKVEQYIYNSEITEIPIIK